jgi:hypothetical protein
MRVHVSIEADDSGPALSDLHRWFRQDGELRRHADVRLLRPRRTEGLMGAVEIIELVLGQGIAAANLALAYATWRQGRATEETVTFTVGEVSITVKDGSEESVRQILELLRSEND